MNERDLARLRDMLNYGRDALQFVSGKNQGDLETNLILARALTYTVGVIGEAASQVSREFQDAHAEIPWPKIIAMRNRLFHGYGEINFERLYSTVIVELPSLIEQLEQLLTEFPDAPES